MRISGCLSVLLLCLLLLTGCRKTVSSSASGRPPVSQAEPESVQSAVSGTGSSRQQSSLSGEAVRYPGEELPETLSQFSVRGVLGGRLYGCQQDSLAVYDLQTGELTCYEDFRPVLPLYDSEEAVKIGERVYLTGLYGELRQATTALDFQSGKQLLLKQYEFGDTFGIRRYDGENLCLVYARQTFYNGEERQDEARLWLQDMRSGECAGWMTVTEKDGRMVQGMDVSSGQVWLYETQGTENAGDLRCWIRCYNAAGELLESYESPEMAELGDIYHMDASSFRFYALGEGTFVCDLGDGLMTAALRLEGGKAVRTQPLPQTGAALEYLGRFEDYAAFADYRERPKTTVYLLNRKTGEWLCAPLETQALPALYLDGESGMLVMQWKEGEHLSGWTLSFEQLKSLAFSPEIPASSKKS